MFIFCFVGLYCKCSSIHGIFQARVLEWVLEAFNFVRTPKVPRHPGFPRGEHRESRHRFICNSLSSLPGRVILEKASCPEADQTSQSQILSWLLNGKVRLVQRCVLLANYLFSSFLGLTQDYTIKFQRRSNMPLAILLLKVPHHIS